MEHTKGKWVAQVAPTSRCKWLIYCDGVICRMEPESKEGKANARLIAAAPELLAACKMAREWLGSDMVATSKAQEQVDEAIAKAENTQDASG